MVSAIRVQREGQIFAKEPRMQEKDMLEDRLGHAQVSVCRMGLLHLRRQVVAKRLPVAQSKGDYPLGIAEQGDHIRSEPWVSARVYRRLLIYPILGFSEETQIYSREGQRVYSSTLRNDSRITQRP
jgi:hypothetical protein